MDLSEFLSMVSSDAALRRRRRLQPAGGKGDKIFPATYPGSAPGAPRHVFERRRDHGTDVWCCLVDSVQSQANRLEESLLSAIRSGDVAIPHVLVDFKPHRLDQIAEITSLDAPHRIYDAIMRDSLLDGTPFMESTVGRALTAASQRNASTLLEVSPTALVFGAWHSTGAGGGLGAKFARCLVSEIIAVNVPVDENPRSGEVQTAGRRTGSRIDPLGVLKRVEVYKGESGWALTADDAGKDAKKVRPSEINHGNIAPSVQPLGITCDWLEHTVVISFAALRRLSFGSDERNKLARAYLGALGLLAVTEQDVRGYALRSRCDLVPEQDDAFECVHADGTTTPLEFDPPTVRDLYKEAYETAKALGFRLREEPLRLTPQAKLVEIIRRSQELALEGRGGDDPGQG